MPGRSGDRFKALYPRGAATNELQAKFDDKHLLFYIEKSQNHNSVLYEANVDANGKLDPDDPVKVYWVLYARSPIIEEGLNLLERNTAYGKTVVKNKEKPGHFTLRLVALKQYEIDVFVDEQGIVHAQVQDDESGETVELVSVYVETTTSWGMPKVHHIDVNFRRPDGTVATKRIENN